MSVSQVPGIHVPPQSTAPDNGAQVGGQPPAVSGPIQSSDAWKFGASNTRFETNGTVRWATDDEINAAVRTTPAAMLSVLNTGADILRFEANGVYSKEAAAIASIYENADLTTEEVAQAVADATASLREKMTNDVRNGLFRVNNSGQVVHTRDGVETILAPEEVGFELNSVLIKAMEEEILELNNLNSRLNQMNQFVASELDSGEQELIIDYDRQLFRQRQEKEMGSNNVQTIEDWHDASNNGSPAPSKFGPFPYNSWVGNQPHRTPLEQFVSNTYSDYSNSSGEGTRFLDDLRNEYESLMQHSDLELENWLAAVPDSQSQVNTGSWSSEVEFHDEGGAFGHLYFERIRDRTRNVNQQQVKANTFEIASQKVETRIRTVGSLAEQMGTDFKTDNSRFNNLLEAMNNYNKLVADSLQRFSVI